MATDTRPQHDQDHATIGHDPMSVASSLVRPRTRDVLHTVIQSATTDNSLGLTRRGEKAPERDNAIVPTIAPNCKLAQTRCHPLRYGAKPYRYSVLTMPVQLYKDYEAELLAYIAANANNLSSSMLSEKTHAGMSTFFNGARRFPGQIDGFGRNLIETLDDPGDITNIEFQQLNLDDAAQVSDDDAPQQSLDANSSKGHSLAITITVRPKGKTREQLYYCAIMKDRLSVDNKRSRQLVMQWLERKFDCRICRLVFQSYELRSIVDTSLQVMYNHAQGRGDKKERPIELHYSFPESVDTLKNMSVSLPVEDARQLLVSRNDGSNAGLLEGVEAHCADTMMIDFGRLVLTRAGCSSWYIASEGKAKIFPVIAERHSVADFIREIGKCGT
ncbi:hypothetical protein BGX34_011822 [Mortierella sp. NVP85]|nr:hypothetical protein BGX34_011822 [Mortierella sp. NVP85]